MIPTSTPEAEVVDLVDSLEDKSCRVAINTGGPDPLDHFHLHLHPFADNVNPEFFFRTEAHEEAFILMKRAVEDDAALALCTALSGTGKTLLTQILLQELPAARCRTVLTLVYPEMSRTALLRDILVELDVEPPGRATSVHMLLSTIQQEIIRLHRQGKKLVLIIDEAHFLNADALHILRTLSNIEVPEKKLISVLLFGEETFRARLEKACYRALLSRMFVRTTLRPLRSDEVEQYIKFRCLMAGGSGEIFTPEAHGRIAEATGGIPREINRLAHSALLTAARRGLPRVDAALIEALLTKA